MRTDFKKIFIDTAPFIYFIEKNEDNPQYFDKLKSFLAAGLAEGADFYTSVITIEEYLVFPYRTHKTEYEKIFMKLLNDLNVNVIPIDVGIAKKAAAIRAEYNYFKAMDSLQLAAACENKCDIFLTNDKQLKQFKELKCITIDDLT